MLKYNLYYNNQKINKRPISKADLDKIQANKIINKYNDKTKELVEIPTNRIEIIKCYVV